MRLALDSTDSVRGGCTTHVALKIWERLADLDVRGAPRLVRLNPNVPYKTRGNGALCLDLGHGRGRRRLAGISGGRELHAAETIEEPDRRDQERIFRVAVETVDELRERDEPPAQPAVVLAPEAPPESAYWAAVRGHVEAAPAPARRVRACTWGGTRGLIGATAAAAWPGQRGTYEVIAYRPRLRWGSRRRLDPAIGPRLDARFPTTFDNWDARHRKLRVMPNSPCPILAGIRGTDPLALQQSLGELGPETPADWVVFETNQATGDHLVERSVAELGPYQSGRIEATVGGAPWDSRGGHVFVRLRDETGELVAAAFEPTKEFRDAVRRLRPGDRVRAEGSVHGAPFTLALEAFTLLEGSSASTVESRCPDCDVGGRSRGRRAGFACPRCGRPLEARSVPASKSPGGRATVPVLVRRHLSTPPSLEGAALVLAPGGIAA